MENLPVYHSSNTNFQVILIFQVVPNDDGIFQNDVLLSIEQSNYLINAYKDPKSRKKRQSLFLDDMPNAKWNISQPIVYFFDISFGKFFCCHSKRIFQTVPNGLLRYKSFILAVSSQT